MSKFIDLTGKIFDRLTVVERDLSKRHKNKTFWICKCICGNILSVPASALKSGNTKSCGCLHRDNCKLMGLNNITHGRTHTDIYIVRKNMIDRCYNSNHKSYKYYGERGITVCDRWLESFENFFEDMGDPPSRDYQLDRIDNDGPYSLENCRWATGLENGRNKRNNVFISFNGETHHIAEWSRISGIPPTTIAYRKKKGLSDIEILSTPVKGKPNTGLQIKEVYS